MLATVRPSLHPLALPRFPQRQRGLGSPQQREREKTDKAKAGGPRDQFARSLACGVADPNHHSPPSLGSPCGRASKKREEQPAEIVETAIDGPKDGRRAPLEDEPLLAPEGPGKKRIDRLERMLEYPGVWTLDKRASAMTVR